MEFSAIFFFLIEKEGVCLFFFLNTEYVFLNVEEVGSEPCNNAGYNFVVCAVSLLIKNREREAP